jgi:hypothetical protein
MAWISASAAAVALALASPAAATYDLPTPTVSGVSVSLQARQAPTPSEADSGSSGGAESGGAPTAGVGAATTSTLRQAMYTVVVTSTLPEPVEVAVAQEFAGPVGALSGADALSTNPDAAVGTSSVGLEAGKLIWRFQLPPNGTLSLDSVAELAPGTDAPVSTVCANATASGQVLDCANDMPPASGSGASLPAWITGLGWWWLVLLGGLALIGFLAYKIPWSRLGHRLQVRSTESRYGLLPALLAVMLLAGGLFAGLALVGPTLTRTAANETSHGSGWYGERSALTLGLPTSDGVVEFTIHHWNCDKDATDQWCRATVELRNVSDTEQSWFSAMQRLYLDDKVWATPDPAATLAINGGVDVFGKVPAGVELTAPLAFRIALDAQPHRLELRENRFARGVYLNLER